MLLYRTTFATATIPSQQEVVFYLQPILLDSLTRSFEEKENFGIFIKMLERALNGPWKCKVV